MNRAIDILQTEPKRRGRKPGSVSASAPKAEAKRRGRPKMTPAARKAVSERMKKYWAARRRADKKK